MGQARPKYTLDELLVGLTPGLSEFEDVEDVGLECFDASPSPRTKAE